MAGNKKKKNNSGTGSYYDYNLLAAIVLLVCFGLIILYSTSAYIAQRDFNDDVYFFKKQTIFSVVFIFIAIVVSFKFDYHFFSKYIIYGIYGVSFFCMLLVEIGFGTSSHGATRWLKIGPISFQPAEIAKIAVILMCSYMIVNMGKEINTLKGCFKLLAVGGIQAVAAYVFTDNLSTAIIILAISGGMVFIANPYTKPFIALALGGVILLTIVVFSIDQFGQDSTSFRIQRIVTWLHPERDATGDGYQTLQALYAIGSGGFSGRGLGNSIQKLGSVPEAQNDMIFSIICEELGILGAVLVVGLFLFLLFRLMAIAQNAPDLFGCLLVSGIFIHIAIQVILNIAVVLNVAPNTGVTLPFISYGGTSIGFIMAEMALALAVSRQIRVK